MEKPLGQLHLPIKHKASTLLTYSPEIIRVLGWFSDRWTSSSCSDCVCFSIFTEQCADSSEKLAQDDNKMVGLFVLSTMATVSLIWRPSSEPDGTNSPKREILCCEGGEALAWVAQKSSGCPMPGNVQGQAGWGFEQPGLVGGVPALDRGVGTRWSLRCLPTQTILWTVRYHECISNFAYWFIILCWVLDEWEAAASLGFVDLIKHMICFTRENQVRLCVMDNWMFEGALLAGVSPWGVNERKHNIFHTETMWEITMETVSLEPPRRWKPALSPPFSIITGPVWWEESEGPGSRTTVGCEGA